MKIPIVKYSNKFLTRLTFIGNVSAMALFPYIILREEYDKPHNLKVKEIIINHETIHIHQQKELLVIPFYAWYFIEWVIRLFMEGNAYRNISFEREAYANEGNLDYLKTRKWYSFLKYIKYT